MGCTATASPACFTSPTTPMTVLGVFSRFMWMVTRLPMGFSFGPERLRHGLADNHVARCLERFTAIEGPAADKRDPECFEEVGFNQRDIHYGLLRDGK